MPCGPEIRHHNQTNADLVLAIADTLGNIDDKLGHLDEANSPLQHALDQRKALFGPESPEVAGSLVALSQLRADQARFPEAEQFARQAIEMDTNCCRQAIPLELGPCHS
ncbi:MAG: tetratricopeptide repeat protein [Acidobacteria bacterium]|nr:tetratricopeptide repeat protein [Acidobacteriota bacterium]